MKKLRSTLLRNSGRTFSRTNLRIHLSSRYRTHARIPLWLNEGLAEFIGNMVYIQPGGSDWARHHAEETPDISEIFDDSTHKQGDFYPVMQAMVASLIQQNKNAFVQMFDAIKDGAPAEKALQKFYGIDYTGLDKAWRRYAMMH